jgi:hypothetical protein
VSVQPKCSKTERTEPTSHNDLIDRPPWALFDNAAQEARYWRSMFVWLFLSVIGYSSYALVCACCSTNSDSGRKQEITSALIAKFQNQRPQMEMEIFLSRFGPFSDDSVDYLRNNNWQMGSDTFFVEFMMNSHLFANSKLKTPAAN